VRPAPYAATGESEAIQSGIFQLPQATKKASQGFKSARYAWRGVGRSETRSRLCFVRSMRSDLLLSRTTSNDHLYDSNQTQTDQIIHHESWSYEVK
jgi:hypothetical protein